jgi:small subunit ribosomal protein S6
LSARNYELMLVVSTELDEEALDTLLQRVQQYLDAVDAQIFSFRSWGTRRLAYTIQGQREGRYYLVHFAADTQAIDRVDRNLRLAEGILRHMITRMVGQPVSQEPDSDESSSESAS